MRRIGIFGGSFNPIHNGHLHLAQTAQQKLSLEEVIFVPTRISPFKQHIQGVADGTARLEMCRLATEEIPSFSVSDTEIRRAGVSYTIHTLQHFRQELPDAQLVLLMGSDMLLHFERWYCWQEILQIAELGVVSREEQDGEILRAKQHSLLQFGKIHVFTEDAIPLSSTKIRNCIKKQEDFACYLPKKVVQYILSHHLYQKD